MKRDEWFEKIKEQCIEAKTYKPYFDDVISTLAQILESRDEAHAQYLENGSLPTITHTNKAKESNIVKNPMLVMRNDLNSQALQYWHALGLTPSGLKKINEQTLNKETKKQSALEKALNNFNA